VFRREVQVLKLETQLSRIQKKEGDLLKLSEEDDKK
jgi:hypothetical protein